MISSSFLFFKYTWNQKNTFQTQTQNPALLQHTQLKKKRTQQQQQQIVGKSNKKKLRENSFILINNGCQL